MRYKILVFVTMFVLLGSGLVSAGEVKIQGELTSNLAVELEEDNQIANLENLFELEVSKYASNSGLVKAVVEFSDQQEKQVNLKEAFAELYFPNYDLKVGKQRITWGKTDAFNPTSNFNPENLTQPLAEENKLPVPAVRVKYYYEDWIIDGVAVPKFNSASYPQQGEEWYLPQYAKLEQAQEPKSKLTNGEFGVRVAKWSSFVDAAVSYQQGWSKQPYPTAAGLKHLRREVVGTAWTKDFGKFVMRGEAAYSFFTETDDLLEYALDVDFKPVNDWQVIIELAGEKSTDKSSKQRIVLSNQYDLTTYQQVELNTVYNLADDSYLINPKYNYTVQDGVDLTAEVYLFKGDADTEWGALDNKDCIVTKLTKSF